MYEFFLSPFFFTIVLVLLYSSFLIAIAGTMMHLGQLENIAGSIAHSILAGVGLAVWLQFSIWSGTIIVAVIVCFLFSWVTIYAPKYLSIFSNTIWGSGMAFGVLFSSFAKGYQQSLANFLFGNIVLVSKLDGYIILGLALFILLFFCMFYRQLFLFWMSPIFAMIQNIPRVLLSFLSMFAVALAVISLVKTMGIALALILLSVPQHIAYLLSQTILQSIFISFIIAFSSMLLGLIFSYLLSTPAGATTVLCCLCFYGLLFFRKRKS